MKVETYLRGNTIKEIAAAARWAEEIGYDGVLSAETAHEPFLPLMIAAEHTERVTLAPSVAIAFPRSPMVTANAAWDLQHFSSGRFILGLGTQVKGHNERRFSVPWTSPGPRLREYVLSLRAIWDCWQNGTKLDFRGEHYTFTLMTFNFNPGPIENPHIPIHIAALNTYNAQLAGEVCDGIRVHPLCTPKYTREVLLPAVEAGARKAGRSLEEIDICFGGFIITGETRDDVERAKAASRRQIAFYGSTRTYKPVFDVHGWGDTVLKLHEMSLYGNKWNEMAQEITDEMLDDFAIIGTHDEIVPKIKERLGGLFTRISFSIPVQNDRDKGRLREMIQALKSV